MIGMRGRFATELVGDIKKGYKEMYPFFGKSND